MIFSPGNKQNLITLKIKDQYSFISYSADKTTMQIFYFHWKILFACFPDSHLV